MNKEQRDHSKDRSKVCSRLAVETSNMLEEKIKEVTGELENSMEIDHFLACLNNRLAVLIFMKFNCKQNPLKG